ncbi:NACHT domain-containing protein [Pseudomonas syringae group genomosp. 3]|uniref:NACHT domain-containing protein n=1 Tax=Pseudomonas syringae group genomosp. 3 TaxID=251701 RepID=UPI0011876B84|nr:hypothetical protein [Pseudomonas syringae group genomosp. 3]
MREAASGEGLYLSRRADKRTASAWFISYRVQAFEIRDLAIPLELDCAIVKRIFPTAGKVMDYDFSRLTTRSFEQLIQALSISILGGKTQIFGDGPDGGREATFQGTTSVPEKKYQWDGYIVIQAKFRQKTRYDDNDWALIELKKELEKFANTTRALKAPEYYIFATNISLSSVAESGGKDRASKLIESYKSKIGLKDYTLWDQDQISRLIDGQEQIRKSYAAWITPGDVLSEIINNLKLKTPDFRTIMHNFIQKEMRSEHYVNLGQAGNSGVDEIPLASVYVDLPLEYANHFPEPEISQSNEENQETFSASFLNEQNVGAIERLIAISSNKLDPQSNIKESISENDENTISANQDGKIVFVGGPGQGKSTLTQFFCQINRAKIINSTELQVDSETKKRTKSVLSTLQEEGMGELLVARFPFRIELNKFAAELANNQVSSVLQYIAKRIKTRTDYSIEPEDLRTWLKSYPWLIALDGLDEVPATSNRVQVIEKIQDFLVDAFQANSDLMLIATTRPQGYSNDFSPRLFQHLKLKSLDTDIALKYAKKLINRRWSNDTDKAEQLLSRLSIASAEESTVRLMQSPLQVTIMALLVETLGEPPKERWRLFNEYYQVINRREKERAIPAAKLLNTYQADIDAIHQSAGHTLQISSEKTGGTNSLLDLNQFSDLVDDRLEKEGHTGIEKNNLQESITAAALERLVFLVAPQENQIGFEIRSLQEFMAAQHLMTGTDKEVLERLKLIAGAAHWRNVFLFAAGRCFHDKQHLRSGLHMICCELNEQNEDPIETSRLNKIIFAGSVLALDILEDGAVANQPGQTIIYLRLALRATELPPSQEQIRLGNLYKEKYKEIFYDHLSQKMDDTIFCRTLGAWQTLAQLIKQDISWAFNLAEDKWPKNLYESAKLIKALHSNNHHSNWLNEKTTNTNLQLPIIDSFWPTEKGTDDVAKLSNSPDWLNEILDSLHRSDQKELKIKGIPNSFKFKLISHKTQKLVSLPQSPVHPEWRWLAHAMNFNAAPSKELLSELLTNLSSLCKSNSSLELGQWIHTISWPLLNCVVFTENKVEYIRLAEAAINGELGDFSDWQKAELRWIKDGITSEDLNYKPNNLPYDKSIAALGFPYKFCGMSLAHDKHTEKVPSALLNFYTTLDNDNAKALISRALLFAINSKNQGATTQRILAEFPEIIGNSEWTNIRFLDGIPDSYWEKDEPLIEIERLGQSSTLYAEQGKSIAASKIERRLRKDENNESLINLLSILCSKGHIPLESTSTHTTFLSQKINAAAVIIELSKENPKLEPASHFADILVKNKSHLLIFFEALKVKNPKHLPEKLLVSIYETISSEDWENKKRLLAILQTLHKSKFGLARESDSSFSS